MKQPSFWQRLLSSDTAGWRFTKKTILLSLRFHRGPRFQSNLNNQIIETRIRATTYRQIGSIEDVWREFSACFTFYPNEQLLSTLKLLGPAFFTNSRKHFKINFLLSSAAFRSFTAPGGSLRGHTFLCAKISFLLITKVSMRNCVCA